MKKFILFLFMVTLSVSMILFSQSCDSNEEEFVNVSASTIAETDEFVDFIICSSALQDKFLAYTKTLNQSEFEELMNNLNNDEYMFDIVDKAGLEDDIQSLVNSKKNLLRNTDYSNLNISEQKSLLVKYSCAPKETIAKTRTESSQECDKRRLDDYAWARAIADLELIGCTCSVEIPLLACACYTATLASYANNIRLADRAYEDCMKGF